MKLHLLLMLSIVVGFSACSVKQPNTWNERIIKEKQKALPLAYSEYGDSKNETLLFLHGFGESKETWRFLVPDLAKKYHLVLVDMKGFGDSPKTEDSAYSVYDQAKIVAKFMEEKKLEEVNIVAHSLGGGVALVLALMQKDKLLKSKINKFILIDTVSYKQGLPAMLETLNQPVIGYLAIHFASTDWMAKEAYNYAFYKDDLIPKESVELTSASMSKPLAKYAYLETVSQLVPDDIDEVQKRYKEIDLETLILWGEEDISLRLYQGRRLHKDLKNSRLVVFPKVGHMPQEEIPKKVSHEILKFMAEK